jgi:outer membrane protein OmpA-like peptidoglycan-associated protein
MNRMRAWLLLAALAVAGAAGPADAADAPDADSQRLIAVLVALDNDPALADKAPLERFKARQALTALQAARSRDRAHALLLANAWVEAAQASAQAELLRQQSAQLDRDRDQIMLEASRRDAEMARREADRLRLQSQAREEEAERLAEQERLQAEQSAASVGAAQAQASQALKLAGARARETELARKEAELAAAVAADSGDNPGALPPSRRVGARTIYTLPGSAFASGSSQLSSAAQGSLRRLAALLGGGRSVRIEAHTDSQGNDAANLALSQRRADAVAQWLRSAGVPGARLKATGKGEADPLVDNGSAAGRARNRRVELIVE